MIGHHSFVKKISEIIIPLHINLVYVTRGFSPRRVTRLLNHQNKTS